MPCTLILYWSACILNLTTSKSIPPGRTKVNAQHRRAIYTLKLRYGDGKSNRPFVSTSGVRKFQISQFSYCWASNKFFYSICIPITGYRHPYFANNMRILRWLWLFLAVGAYLFGWTKRTKSLNDIFIHLGLWMCVSHWT